MNIILLTKDCAKSSSVSLNHWTHFSVLALLIFSVFGGLFAVGYFLGSNQAPELHAQKVEHDLLSQRREMEKLRQQNSANLLAMTQRLGDMQARLIRLDALGNKLVKMADLDKTEFNFAQKPAQGGPSKPITEIDFSKLEEVPDTINQLSKELENREYQLSVLDNLILSQNLTAAVYPEGRPIKKGWISSYYGLRSDPFTGRPQRHQGIDLASPFGSDIISVGAGIVTWAGKRYGYGNMVEINHGNGYVTRYAHASKVLTQVGQSVKRGEVIALIGSSGRSTGPHLHFEVLKNGRHVNPINFVQ